MRIHTLKLHHFRGFKDLTIDFHDQCTVLIGINGTGKTSILEGLCVALGSWFLGFPDVPARGINANDVMRRFIEQTFDTEVQIHYPARIEATGQVQGQDITWSRELRSASGKTTTSSAQSIKTLAERAVAQMHQDAPIALPIIAYYGAGRLWVQKQRTTQKLQGLTTRDSAYSDCLDPASDQKLFLSWMRRRTVTRLEAMATQSNTTLPQDPEFQAITTAVLGCLPDATDMRYSIKHEDILVTFDHQRTQTFQTLSDGYRNLLALTADIAWRAVRLNPHLSSEMPEQARGVVLIDEIALHLHPAWQRTVLPSLRQTFPNIQFIVTTHSPQVLSSVEPQCLRRLGAASPQTTSISYGLDSNTILRDLMGVAPRPEIITQHIEHIETLIEDNQLKQAQTHLDALQQILGHDDPTITQLLWELHDATRHANH